MTYTQSEMPTVITTGNGYSNGGMWGQDGIWAILLLALLGNNGFGFGGRGGYGGGYGAGSEVLGYELGKVATTNDVASGFNNSAVLSSLNDLKLGQASGFAGVQQTLCQGFNGINTAILQTQNSIDNSICTLGYQQSQLVNGLSRELSECCCSTKQAIADLKYSNEKNTCDIINAFNQGNQRLIDIYTADKIDTLNRKLSIAENQISQSNQTSVLLNAINRTPIPSYNVPNPYCCYTQCCNSTGTSVI